MRRGSCDVLGQRALDNGSSQRLAALNARMRGALDTIEPPVKRGAMEKRCLKIDLQVAKVEAAKMGCVSVQRVGSRGRLPVQAPHHLPHPREKMPLLRLELLRCQCEPNQDGRIVERRTRPRQSGIARSGAVHAVLKRRQQRWVGLARDGVAERSNCRKARRVIVAVQPGCIAVHAPRDAQPRVRLTMCRASNPSTLPLVLAEAMSARSLSSASATQTWLKGTTCSREAW